MTIDYTRQSAYSDPRGCTDLVAALPADLPALGAAVRNLVVHYSTSGIDFSDDRLSEADSRWIDRLLGHDRRRCPAPLDARGLVTEVDLIRASADE